MFAHNLDEMTDAVCARIGKEHRGPVLDALEGYWADRIALVWHLSDLDNYTLLTEAERRRLLDYVFDHQDAAIGVTWETFHNAASHLFPGRAVRDDDEEESDGA